MNHFLRLVDGLNTWIGRTVGWVMIFIMLVTVYDVVARRLFNAPVLWAFDVSVQLFALHFMIVAAYTLLHKEHVSIYIFKERLSVRNQALLDILSFLIFFFPFVIALLVYGWEFAARSWASRETSWGAVALPVYYIKTVIPVTAALLILQGICTMIRLVDTVRTGEAK
ncbi:TRAP transporter small permease subunit [Aliihoeflea sp. 40Bstr573]|jgi:TRAP-type mannitol/chloroaromatic compound transport system permease small subunit|uniref:TRAP transporter small permease subunit n=1 Tax=Aliihoeflea sp. 40Bstr573 TaxID=2696467 RepID=UPI002095B771|nr:TRAP transporter small permease subunit [Aliihoeflea sp. 40Bstr573]MCO6388727.1 TRAP transporter small permease subunit [Aliihoeflea sp. 40Bstr573]